jgi:predicted dehydrogenase
VSAPLRLGLVGLGKIARDQHLPAIAANAGLELAAVASRNARADGVAGYPDLETMLAAEPTLDAIVLCQPPQVRFAAASAAIAAGKHVFLEKPPGATVGEVLALAALATAKGVSLFASWHSRYAAGVSAARDWVAARAIARIAIAWKEDVRHWHPGQPWIWQPGGFGVFDPGINALSILTEIVRDPIVVEEAMFDFPANCAAPIAASLAMRTSRAAPISVEFDWRQTGPQTWDILVETDGGTLLLSHGGNRLFLDGVAQPAAPEQEYPAMYRHFAALVAAGGSDVDVAPLQLAADAFLCGRHRPTDAFHE